MTNSPLVTRSLDSNFAYLQNPLPVLSGQQGVVTVGEFLGHVQLLAKQLPDHQFVINLCGNRYLFTVAFCAAMLRGQTNLLPPNTKVLTQEFLQENYPDAYILHDGQLALSEKLPAVDLADLEFSNPPVVTEVPEVSRDHLSAIAFTSGSTGQSQPNLKRWRCFFDSTEVNGRYLMMGREQQTHYLMATVPPQHMWGLEMSVLVPLRHNVCMVDSKPFYPAEIQQTLAAIPTPRAIVSTPVHLRAIVASGLDYPDTAVIGCATAPLDVTLAQQSEAVFNGELREVYGCSEIGSMAIRRTATETVWEAFDCFILQSLEDEAGGYTLASADHIDGDVRLQDILHWPDPTHFELRGRSADIINIAGKRGSLKELNYVLMQAPGMIDGVIFMPESQKGVERVAGLVVLAEGTSVADVQSYLRSRFDDVFLPRPFLAVEKLPREETGKLPRKNLLSFFNEQMAKVRS